MCDSQRVNMATCYSSYEIHQQHVQVPHQQPAARTPQLQKDYSRPLHVDCSVEYELPNQAKPPVGVRNEPLLMIHPCYFRKIESQRRSPFVNNLPTRQQQLMAKRRMQQQQQAVQHRQHQVPAPQQWEAVQPLPPLIPIAGQTYVAPQAKRDHMLTAAYASSTGSADSGHWTDSDKSPEKTEDKHILSGKYRQYLRAHRLHPYVTSSIPLASTFPQIQQVCYNV